MTQVRYTMLFNHNDHYTNSLTEPDTESLALQDYYTNWKCQPKLSMSLTFENVIKDKRVFLAQQEKAEFASCARPERCTKCTRNCDTTCISK